MNPILKITSLLGILCLCACGGGGDSATTEDTTQYAKQVLAPEDFVGSYNVAYNVVIDECDPPLVENGDLFVDDFQTVSLNGDKVEVTSDVLPLGLYEAELRAEDSFVSEFVFEDFAPGIGVCAVTFALAYNNITETQADTLYHAQIKCQNGLQCDSVLRGTATRAEEGAEQAPSPEEEAVTEGDQP